MKIQFENKDSVLMENCFIDKNKIGVYGWYGLTYFEIGLPTTLGKKDIYDLRDCLNDMIKEIERLNKIGVDK